MNERITVPVQTSDYAGASIARLRLAEATQTARVIAIDLRATCAKGAFFASSVLRRMHGEPVPIEWDPDLEDVDQELANREREEMAKLAAIYQEMSRRRVLRQATPA